MSEVDTTGGAAVRETYEEFELRDTTVAMVSDPHNEYAWVQSSLTVPVER
ncbi:hypothetical protein [Salinirussus salinus]|jgi:hypothetical protein|nr:hypothetical protein [Salinirussus salinus]